MRDPDAIWEDMMRYSSFRDAVKGADGFDDLKDKLKNAKKTVLRKDRQGRLIAKAERETFRNNDGSWSRGVNLLAETDKAKDMVKDNVIDKIRDIKDIDGFEKFKYDERYLSDADIVKPIKDSLQARESFINVIYEEDIKKKIQSADNRSELYAIEKELDKRFKTAYPRLLGTINSRNREFVVKDRVTVERIQRMNLPQALSLERRGDIDTAAERDALVARRDELMGKLREASRVRHQEWVSRYSSEARLPIGELISRYPWVTGLRSTSELKRFFYVEDEQAREMLNRVQTAKRLGMRVT